MIKRFLPGLLALSYLCASVPSGRAQIVSGFEQGSSSLGTWEQTPGSGEAWVEAPPAGSPDTGLSYNVWRAVPADASLGRTIKFGDLTNTYLPNGDQYFKDKDRSVSELLQSQGRTTDNVKVGDSSYTAGLTLGEVIQANGGNLPSSLEAQLRSNQDDEYSPRSGINQARPLFGVSGSLAKELIDNPVIQEIPLSELASGNFQGALDVGVQRGAQEAIKNLPANWKDLPVGSIAGSLASGDYKSALQDGINYGGKRLAEYILKTDALKNLPVGAIAKDLPLSELGNITTQPLSALPRIGSQYISKIPGIKDASVIQSGVSAAIALARGDLAVKLDVAYAAKREQPSPNAFTGGTPNNTFSATNCVINSTKKGRGKTTNCAHFEMGEMNIGTKCTYDAKNKLKDKLFSKCRYKGMQMVDGQTQPSKGGKGILAKVNGGWEPTGWKPFGDADGYNPAKLSLKNIKEHPGKGKIAEADIQLDLQICMKIFFKTTCTPHMIPVPTPFKARQNSLLLLLASGPPPKVIQDAINSISNRDETCQGTVVPQKPLDKIDTTAQHNIKQYLALIAAGETDGGLNIGVRPLQGSNDPYGEYQFRGSTRDAVLSRYPDLDAWSSDKATRDRAALAWIGMYSKEVGVDLLASIQRGDFATANRVLGQNQFTSLPGGSEQSQKWNNPNTVAKYGPTGNASANITTTECQPFGAGGKTVAAGPLQQRISDASRSYYGADTSAGPDGGNEACVYAVNNVLSRAGVQPFQTNYVPSVHDELTGGRGTLISQSTAKAGDIVLSKGYYHIGICQNDGCTQILSNSSSRARFSWQSDGNFGGTYENRTYTQPQEVWRLNK